MEEMQVDEVAGGEMRDFSVLQKKTFPSGVHVALCPTMDICAVLSNSSGASSTSHVLDAFRTFTWERNFSKSDIVGSSVTAFSFSPSGKVIAVGSEDGSVAILDLESTNSVTSLSEEQLPFSPQLAQQCDGSTRNDTAITAMSWIQLGLNLPKWMDKYYHHIWSQGGPNLAARAGMRELHEADDIDSDQQSGTIPLPLLLSAVAHTLLLTLSHGSQRLNIYACGIYRVHSIDLSSAHYSLRFIVSGTDFEALFNGMKVGKVSVITSNSGESSCVTLVRPLFNCDEEEFLHGDSGFSRTRCGLHVTLVRHLSFLSTYRWHQHKTRLLLQMQKDLSRINSLLLECGKKWRDAAKVIPMKLSLLASTLKGYEMEYSPVQFFYTVALFGQWHPAAQSSFSSHWNEQGLQRLRSSIATAATDIEKRLQMYVIPVITNFLLSCRELVGIEEVEHELALRQKSSPLFEDLSQRMLSRKVELSNLINNTEWLIYKVDEALHETIFAGRNLLLFLNFLKENMLLASSDEANSDSSSVQQESPFDYLPLFDPRVPRAAEGVLGPKAQAECVTGTHLYAYFLEAPLPADVVEYRKPFNGFYSNVRAEFLPGFENAEKLKEMLAIAEENSNFDKETFSKTSLLSQFKTTSNLFQSVLQHGQHMPHLNFQSDPDCDPENLDVNIIFNFRQTSFGKCMAEDVIHVHDINISTDDNESTSPNFNAISDDENSCDGESCDMDLPFRNTVLKCGHLIVFALSCFEFLVIWRGESEEVKWYSSLLKLELPFSAGASTKLTSLKLYSCSSAESRPARVALVGCLSNYSADANQDSSVHHILFKVDLLSTSFCYKNVTDVIVDHVNESGTSKNLFLIGKNIVNELDWHSVSPKIREIQFGGFLVGIKTCASRGVLSLLIADDADQHDMARQMIILDMEEDEDEDDDESDECEEDCEGGSSCSSDEC